MKEPKDMTMDEIISIRQELSNKSKNLGELILSYKKDFSRLTDDLTCLNIYDSKANDCENLLLILSSKIAFANKSKTDLFLVEESLANCEELRRKLNSIYSDIQNNGSKSETYLTNSDFTFDVVDLFNVRDKLLEENKKYNEAYKKYDKSCIEDEHNTISYGNIIRKAFGNVLSNLDDYLDDDYDDLEIRIYK